MAISFGFRQGEVRDLPESGTERWFAEAASWKWAGRTRLGSLWQFLPCHSNKNLCREISLSKPSQVDVVVL